MMTIMVVAWRSSPVTARIGVPPCAEFVASEACDMLAELGGAAAEAAFLRSLESGWFTLTELTESDLARMAALVERYDSLPLGTADASVVASLHGRPR